MPIGQLIKLTCHFLNLLQIRQNSIYSKVNRTHLGWNESPLSLTLLPIPLACFI